MISVFSNWSKQFDSLNVREKRLMFIASITILLLLGVLLVLEPLWLQHNKLERNLKDSSARLLTLNAGVQELQHQLRVDPNDTLKAAITNLQKDKLKLDAEFASQFDELVPPSKMSTVLEQLLLKSSQLALIEMESIAPTNIFTDQDSAQDVALYKHGIRLTLSGNYSEARQFLANAEELTWKIYWQDVSYTVEEYPTATLSLELFTLSTSKAFIHVL